jgi:hypothetical protein
MVGQQEIVIRARQYKDKYENQCAVNKQVIDTFFLRPMHEFKYTRTSLTVVTALVNLTIRTRAV